MAIDAEKISGWVKDGTTTEVPVTESTPEVVETPVVETPAGGSDDSPYKEELNTGGEVVKTPAEQAVEEYFEALLGDEKVKIPRNAKLDWKRGSETGYATIDELRKGFMMQRDYSVKTAEIAAIRKELEARSRTFQQQQAQIAAREAYLAEREAEYEGAMQDPEKAAQYEQHLWQMKNNPVYKRNVEDALRAREATAERDLYREQIAEQEYREVAATLYEAIHSPGMAEQYPGVDPKLVQQAVAQAISAGVAPAGIETVHAAFRQEAQAISRYAAPVQKEVESVRAELDKLRKEYERAIKAAEKNAQTTAAIGRAKAPDVSPAGGAPPGTKQPGPPERFTKDKLDEKLAAWKKKS